MLQPSFLVIEKCKRLLTLSNVAFRDGIIDRFIRLGFSLSYKILNAVGFGISQRKEIVFFVAVGNDRDISYRTNESNC
ncbi:DNA cytosine methyltransferase [Mycoplasma corogypsi]|uniref:DNA cytosine methyltransferase n=1 Tax=Mycoplasma corogypsi TaxID=2106 RepID=UPI003872F540